MTYSGTFWRQETVVSCDKYFDILKRLGVAHKGACRTDGQTNWQTDRMAFSNSAVTTRATNKARLCCTSDWFRFWSKWIGTATPTAQICIAIYSQRKPASQCQQTHTVTQTHYISHQCMRSTTHCVCLSVCPSVQGNWPLKCPLVCLRSVWILRTVTKPRPLC